MGGDGRPQGEGVDEHGGEVGHGEGLEALEGPQGHVGGGGRPQVCKVKDLCLSLLIFVTQPILSFQNSRCEWI